MSQTKQSIRNEWNKNNYDQINIRVRKGEKELITARAAAVGKSLNAYIKDLIDADMSAAQTPEE